MCHIAVTSHEIAAEVWVCPTHVLCTPGNCPCKALHCAVPRASILPVPCSQELSLSNYTVHSASLIQSILSFWFWHEVSCSSGWPGTQHELEMTAHCWLFCLPSTGTTGTCHHIPWTDFTRGVCWPWVSALPENLMTILPGTLLARLFSCQAGLWLHDLHGTCRL